MTVVTQGTDLAAELVDVRARLADAEEVIRAIRHGEVDAVLVSGSDGDQVYTLSGADHVYRRLVETMSEGAATLSAQGVILFGNIRLAELLGRSLETVVGTLFSSHLASADQQSLDTVLAQARTGIGRREISLVTGAGAPVLVYLSASCLRDEEGNVTFCLLVTDLTEQKRHEEIGAAERLARSILEQASGAIVVCDERGRITRASQAALQLCIGSLPMRLFAEAFPLRVSESEAFDLGPVLNGATLRDIEVNLDFQGQNVNLILSAGPLTSGTQILGCVVTLTNITAHRHLEDQFRQAQKMEAIGQLAGGVAHDYNNILSVMLGYTELVLGDLAPTDPNREALEIVRKSGKRAAGLTRQLLAFSRRQVLQSRVLDLNVLVREMQKMLRHLVPECIELELITAQHPDLIKADAGQIEQVLMNLVLNARDAIPDCGTISVEISRVTVQDGAAELAARGLQGEHVALRVIDTGTGMDEKTRTRIFEPFFTTKSVGKGTGLGLSTVFGIVSQSGGAIAVDSPPGTGTTFTVYLPRLEESVRLDAPVSTPGAVAVSPRTILFVEDQDDVRELGRLILEKRGHEVLVAAGAQDAFRVVNEHPGTIHLLVTDVVMPGVNGRDLARMLTRSLPELRVLFMSGYTDDVILKHGVLEAGVPFLEKPFTSKSLILKVTEVLGSPRVPVP